MKIVEQHFVLSRDKPCGSTTGDIYLETGTLKEWLIKRTREFEAVKEAFAANLFALFTHNCKHSPETELVEGINPDNNQKQYMLASQIRPGFIGFMPVEGQVPYAFDEAHLQQRVQNKPIEGLELVLMASALLCEGDLIGNGSGNIGFDVNPAEAEAVYGFRIDFDQTLLTKESCYALCDSLGDMAVHLTHPNSELLIWHLLDRPKAWAAIQHIATISDESIDQLFAEYKAHFVRAIAQEPDEKMRAIDDRTLATLAERVAEIKQNKNQLKRLLEFRHTSGAPTQFFSVKKDPALKSHSDIKKIERFFTLYDNFYTSLHEDFAKHSAQALIVALKKEGPACQAFQDYTNMKAKLLSILGRYEQQLIYWQNYLVFTQGLLDKNYADNMDSAAAAGHLSNIAKGKRTITRLTAQVEIAQQCRAEIMETDQLLAKIQPQATQHYHNSANYAVLHGLTRASEYVEFTLRSTFPGNIVDPYGKTCDEASWASRVDECRTILSQFSEEALIDGMYHYQLHDSEPEVLRVLAALKSESDRNEPYQTTFIDEALKQLQESPDNAYQF